MLFKKQSLRSAASANQPMVSRMVPGNREVFFDGGAFKQLSSMYDRKSAAMPNLPAETANVPASRLTFDGNRYHTAAPLHENRAEIAFLGGIDPVIIGSDPKMQTALAGLKPILEKTDFAVAVLQGNPNRDLDAAVRGFAAMREAGIDCLMDAQLDTYADGMSSLMATLAAENRAQIAHFGAVASPAEDAHISVQIGNITLGLVAQVTMKTKGLVDKILSKKGSQNLLKKVSKEEVGTAIRAMQNDGADFVAAYTAWGPNRNIAACKKIEEALLDFGADISLGVGKKSAGRISNMLRNEYTGKHTRMIDSLGMMTKPGEDSETGSLMCRIVLQRGAAGHVTLIQESIIPFGPGMEKHVSKDETEESPYKQAKWNKDHDALLLPTAQRLMKEEGLRPQLTLAEIYRILGRDIASYQGGYPTDEPVEFITCLHSELRENCVACISASPDDAALPIFTLENAREAGAVLIICPEKFNDGGTDILSFEQDDAGWTCCVKLIAAIRNRYDIKSIAVTGSLGKTTTTTLICSVAGAGRNTLSTIGNLNLRTSAMRQIQKLKPEHEVMVQEVHGGTRGYASDSSKVLQPDITVVSSVASVHLAQLGGKIENVLSEKLGIADGLKPDGVLLLNNDNEYLRNSHPDCKVVRYAIDDSEAAYRAEDITDYGDHLTFAIVCDEGRFETVLHCPGRVNVSNAVCAFAVGRLLGIDIDDILFGIESFTPGTVRNQFERKNGVTILVDAFNASPESLRTSLETICEERKRNGGRCIACVGDIVELGAISQREHLKLGETMKAMGIDIVISLGEKGADIAKRAAELGVEAYAFGPEERKEYEGKIREVVREGDIVLFKASHCMELASSARHVFNV